MKTIRKYSILLSAALTALFVGACTDEYSYEGAGEPDSEDNVGVYFPSTNPTSIEVEPTEACEFTFNVRRYNKNGAQAVPLKVTTNTDDVFTVPATANFADGDSVATVEVSFSRAEIGKNYTLTLTCDSTYYSTYKQGSLQYSVSASRVKWVDAGFYYAEDGSKVEGYANYTEDLVTTFWSSAGNPTYPVKLQERDDKPGYFRLVNAYGAAYPNNDVGDYDDSKDYYILIDATDPDAVYIPSACEQGCDWGYGNFYVHSVAGYYISRGKTDSAEGYYGTYKNGKITFPAGALLFGMANYNSAGLYYSNNSGKFCVVVDPDLDPYRADIETDFEWEEVFTGVYTSSILDNESQVTLMKGTCAVTKDDCDSVFAATYGTAYALVDPYAVDYPIYFGVKDGEITTPIAMQPIGIKAVNDSVYATISTQKSSFTDNVVTLNMTFTNKDKSITYGSFDEVLSNITWTEKGTGTYTYLADLWGEGVSDSGLSLLQRDDSPNTYKITNWLTGVDFLFTWDQTTNECQVKEQGTGYINQGTEIMICELNQYNSSTAEMPSSAYDPETNTFAFNVIYFVDGGYYGYGTETFVLDAAGVKAKGASAASAKKFQKVSVKKGMKHTYNLKGTKTNIKKQLNVPSSSYFL